MIEEVIEQNTETIADPIITQDFLEIGYYPEQYIRICQDFIEVGYIRTDIFPPRQQGVAVQIR